MLDEQAAYMGPSLSPDGRFLALDVDGANVRIDVLDLERGTLTPLVSGFDNAYPVWSPRGDRLAFVSTRAGEFHLFTVSADGSTTERLTTGSFRVLSSSWSPDEKQMAFSATHPDSGEDIWIMRMVGDRSPEPFLQTQANESAPDFSPDGHWIAYSSDQSGRDEIYIRSSSGSGGRRQVSTDGGLLPRWRADGREIFYIADGNMMVVETEVGEKLTLGIPRKLFDIRTGQFALYDVTPDGQRFVMVDTSESKPPPTEIVLVQNWSEELERLVPTSN